MWDDEQCIWHSEMDTSFRFLVMWQGLTMSLQVFMQNKFCVWT